MLTTNNNGASIIRIIDVHYESFAITTKLPVTPSGSMSGAVFAPQQSPYTTRLATVTANS